MKTNIAKIIGKYIYTLSLETK